MDRARSSWDLLGHGGNGFRITRLRGRRDETAGSSFHLNWRMHSNVRRARRKEDGGLNADFFNGHFRPLVSSPFRGYWRHSVITTDSPVLKFIITTLTKYSIYPYILGVRLA